MFHTLVVTPELGTTTGFFASTLAIPRDIIDMLLYGNILS